MERTITIDGREVRLRSSAAILRMYRVKFRRDIIQDMQTIQRAVNKAALARAELQLAQQTGDQLSDEELEEKWEDACIPCEALTMFENIAYLMAKQADPTIPSSVEDWMDGFDTFSIYAIFPTIQELWLHNLETINQQKKNPVR